MSDSLTAEFCTRLDATDAALSLGGVAIVGAGLSISSRFPATLGLAALVWDALESDLLARSSLAEMLGCKDQQAKPPNSLAFSSRNCLKGPSQSGIGQSSVRNVMVGGAATRSRLWSFAHPG